MSEETKHTQTGISRRSFFRGLGSFLASHWLFSTGLIAGAGLVIKTEHDTLTLDLKHLNLSYPHLPAALDKKTIVQLSDLHLESLSISSERLAENVTSLNPDLLVLTGDVISHRSDLDKVVPYLGPLNARHGKYIIMGNNDYSHFSNTLFKRYLETLRSIGWIPLLNDAVYLPELNLAILGIDDPATAHDDVPKAYAAMDEALSASNSASTKLSNPEYSAPFRLVLAHSTDCFDDIATYGADLFLAGHTHGGQIRLPGFDPLITNSYLGDKGIYEGYHLIDGVPLYVNRGIGESSFPWRFNVLPEITAFTLQRGRTLSFSDISAL